MTPFEPKTLQTRLVQVLGVGLDVHEITFRPMFGGITGYTSGRNFASLSDVGLAFKLSAVDRETLLTEPGARPLRYEAAGPVSKHSVLMPDARLADDAFLAAWLERSIGFCQTLPLPKRRTPSPRAVAKNEIV